MSAICRVVATVIVRGCEGSRPKGSPRHGHDSHEGDLRWILNFEAYKADVVKFAKVFEAGEAALAISS